MYAIWGHTDEEQKNEGDILAAKRLKRGVLYTHGEFDE